MSFAESTTESTEEVVTDVKEAEDVAQQDTAEQSPSNLASNASVSESQDYNWKKAREQLDELLQENKRLKEMAQKPHNDEEEDYSELERMDEDEILTKSQALKLSRRESQRLLKKSMDSFRKELTMETLDERIKSRYPDYFSVVNDKIVEDLKRDPLFVKSLRGLDNPYDQACYVYEQQQLRAGRSTVGREAKQLEENASKPRSSNSLGGTSPLHSAMDYSSWPSPDIQKRLYQEMTEAAKGA